MKRVIFQESAIGKRAVERHTLTDGLVVHYKRQTTVCDSFISAAQYAANPAARNGVSSIRFLKKRINFMECSLLFLCLILLSLLCLFLFCLPLRQFFPVFRAVRDNHGRFRNHSHVDPAGQQRGGVRIVFIQRLARGNAAERDEIIRIDCLRHVDSLLPLFHKNRPAGNPRHWPYRP